MRTLIVSFLSATLLAGSVRSNAVDDNRNFYSKSKAVLPRMAAADELSKNLEYDFGKASIRTAYYGNLDKLAKFLLANKVPLALRGYADSIGRYKANWVLSDKRAAMVKSYLVTKGVPDNTIVTTPFGSTKPIASNKTSQGRQRNRRVEIKISQS